MRKMTTWFGLIVILTLLAGCGTVSIEAVQPTALATSTPPPSATQPLATTAAPQPTDTATSAPMLNPTATAPASAATATPTSGGAAGGAQPDYLDDRSTPSGLVLSLFNAISRKEYLRAYSYWQNPTSNPNAGTFDQYQKGYQNTAAVQVTLGTISSGAGAGQRYYSVPVVLKAQTTSGQTQTFAGCYVLHMSTPDIQTAPPFQPMGIQSAEVKQADNSADANTLLAGACQPTGGPVTAIPTTDPNTITAANYLDDRSTAVEVLRSLFNAVNRKEYARGYSYWQVPAQPFAQFQQGYQNTAAVDAAFGAPTSDVGAGQIRYRVPVTLKAQTTDGKTQFFTGCYQLHLAQPAIQATPPFQPLGIERALVKPAASETDAANQMAGICANMQ